MIDDVFSDTIGTLHRKVEHRLNAARDSGKQACCPCWRLGHKNAISDPMLADPLANIVRERSNERPIEVFLLLEETTRALFLGERDTLPVRCIPDRAVDSIN